MLTLLKWIYVCGRADVYLDSRVIFRDQSERREIWDKNCAENMKDRIVYIDQSTVNQKNYKGWIW